MKSSKTYGGEYIFFTFIVKKNVKSSLFLHILFLLQEHLFSKNSEIVIKKPAMRRVWCWVIVLFDKTIYPLERLLPRPYPLRRVPSGIVDFPCERALSKEPLGILRSGRAGVAKNGILGFGSVSKISSVSPGNEGLVICCLSKNFYLSDQLFYLTDAGVFI